MEANSTLESAARSAAAGAGTPPPRVRELFRRAGVPASIAVWIAVVATGLAAVTVGALIVDHEQTTQYLRVSGAP